MKSIPIVLLTATCLLFPGCSKSSTQNGGNLPNITGYPVVSTNQSVFYDTVNIISAPSSGNAFFGQDAQYTRNEMQYQNNGDGTITDMVTGLMWQRSPDTDGDGDVDAADKKTYAQAVSGASSCTTGGYTDWRLPTIKELYSLIIFSGVDPSGYEGTSTSGLVPFIDTITLILLTAIHRREKELSMHNMPLQTCTWMVNYSLELILPMDA